MRPPGWATPSVLLRTALALGLLSGCVYYNGMYNANRLAKSARKAEREGRTFEANNLWGQVATKAESVVARHPRSKYANEAAVLRGLALARLGQCEPALGPLGRASLIGNSELTEEALLATGRCQVTLGNVGAGDAAFTQLLDSKSLERRREARFEHARALRYAGLYEEALSALEEVREPRADAERLLALAGAGRASESLALADSLLARGDTTKPWDSMMVALGRTDPVAASNLVDRIRKLPNRPSETLARWLQDDGVRLVRTDTARAVARFREAIQIGGSGDAAGRASLQLVKLEVQRATQPQDLIPLVERINELASRYSLTASELIQFGSTVGSVSAAGSATPESPQGDLRVFLAAEAARDTLAAPRLASTMFQRIVNHWPESPYAPKAVLAAQQLDSTWTESARILLGGQYYDSPYLALIRGEDSPAYRQLEDSLAAFAVAAAEPARRRPSDRTTPTPTLRDNAPEPRRPTQPSPGVRVPEP